MTEVTFHSVFRMQRGDIIKYMKELVSPQDATQLLLAGQTVCVVRVAMFPAVYVGSVREMTRDVGNTYDLVREYRKHHTPLPIFQSVPERQIMYDVGLEELL